MPRILLLGAGGQLGMQLKRKLAGQEGVQLTSFGRAELDFSDADAIRAAVRTAQPEIVINAAAYTAVDKAEQELARLVNAVAPELIPIPTEAYPTPARRPKNSRLCCDKFTERFGFQMPEWRDALNDVARTMLR